MSTTGKYREQFDRVQRWYDRFREIDEGKVHTMPSDNYQDEVYSFFLNCYHLKDWVKNDSSCSAFRKVEEFVEKSDELKLCADICNSLKHLRLDTDRSGKDPKFGKRLFAVGLGGGETTIRVKYTIDTSDGPIDAFELATNCLNEWERFFKSNHL